MGSQTLDQTRKVRSHRMNSQTRESTEIMLFETRDRLHTVKHLIFMICMITFITVLFGSESAPPTVCPTGYDGYDLPANPEQTSVPVLVTVENAVIPSGGEPVSDHSFTCRYRLHACFCDHYVLTWLS